MIKGKNIILKFKQKKKTATLLNSISFELKKGRITTFIGKSGSGKTTLLKCIANVITSYEGLLTVDQVDLKKLNSKERASTLGLVLQQYHLFPHLTSLQNCTYALKEILKLKEKDAANIAMETLNLLGMEQWYDAYPSQLSGGQQQRVAIARAMVMKPKILLLDEPTSALDPESKKHLEKLIYYLVERGMTLVLSSHDMPFVQKIRDYIYYMEEGQLVEEWDTQNEAHSNKEKILDFLSNH